MIFVAVLPSIFPDWTDRCVDSMSDTLRGHTLIVDNTVDNIGVSASWNLGVDKMVDKNADWLVVLSAAMRFGPPGGDDFLAQLDNAAGLAPPTVAVEAGHGVGWHCIAFPRHVFDAIGRFDENLSYYGDNDWARRMSLAFGLDPPYWHKTSNLDLGFAGFAHGIDLAGVRPDNVALLDYFVGKWGAPPGGGELFTQPFNDPVKGLDWWPTPPDSRSIL